MENGTTSTKIAHELNRIQRATEKVPCPMCELYEAKERQLRASVQSISDMYAASEGNLAYAMRWKVWCILSFGLLVAIIFGVKVLP